MSLALARNVGPTGSVTSYEIRKDHYDFAAKSALGWDPNHGVKYVLSLWTPPVLTNLTCALRFVLGDVLTCQQSNFDGLLLDVADPTPFLETLYTKVKPGRSIVCIVPNVVRISILSRLRDPSSSSTAAPHRRLREHNSNQEPQLVDQKNC
jgi:tRNA A58 N-methylase Trm61